ncbi:hypothetical protein [Halobacterium bonnevillei]|uniref:hypothetical protein n=1 Tax=Halobacterium bonnevillei TaxID=2692200 RepID=UPI003743E69D
MVTAEPARISEYAVETGTERVDEVRADGVVAATPAGSHGYARDADGPLLSRGRGLAVRRSRGAVPSGALAVGARPAGDADGRTRRRGRLAARRRPRQRLRGRPPVRHARLGRPASGRRRPVLVAGRDLRVIGKDLIPRLNDIRPW